MLEAPAGEGGEGREEGLACGGEVVLDPDWDVGVDAAFDEAVAFEAAEGRGEHAAGDPVDVAQELVEAVGAVGELGEDRDAPFGGEHGNRGLHSFDLIRRHRPRYGR